MLRKPYGPISFIILVLPRLLINRCGRLRSQLPDQLCFLRHSRCFLLVDALLKVLRLRPKPQGFGLAPLQLLRKQGLCDLLLWLMLQRDHLTIQNQGRLGLFASYWFQVSIAEVAAAD